MSKDDDRRMGEAATPNDDQHQYHHRPQSLDHDEPLLHNTTITRTPTPSTTTSASPTNAAAPTATGATSTEPRLPRPPPSYHGNNRPGSDDIEAARNTDNDDDNHESHRPPPNFRAPTDHVTRTQLLQMIVIDGIGSAIIGAGANFGIAYAMYAKIEDIHALPIRLFEFPNTLAGDGGLTIFIQCFLTWFWELWILNASLKRGKGIPAIGSVREPRARWLRWFFFLPLDPDSDSSSERAEEESHTTGSNSNNEKANSASSTGKKERMEKWFRFLVAQMLRVVIISFVCFVVFWPPSMGILTAFGMKRICPVDSPENTDGLFRVATGAAVGGEGCMTDWYFEREWAPQLFKAIQGAVLGLLLTPLMCLFWLVRCGWALRKGEGRYGARVDG